MKKKCQKATIKNSLIEEINLKKLSTLPEYIIRIKTNKEVVSKKV